MGMFAKAKHGFEDQEAAEFRLHVLAGCRKLDVEQLRELADDIHECARARRDAELHLDPPEHRSIGELRRSFLG